MPMLMHGEYVVLVEAGGPGLFYRLHMAEDSGMVGGHMHEGDM
ncbi:MAG: hypothetical protein P8L18_01350 [Verrucomicrobiota bacterium]|nr:hypothetical protein [Verrucomicrobiota bacterium]